MNDKVFGELMYDGGWTKYETIKLWGKELKVRIVVSAYENENPNEAQREAYKNFEKNQEEISRISLSKLYDYIKNIEEDIKAYVGIDALPKDIYKLLSISNILFMENGEFAFMCKAKWDSHGVAILFGNDEVQVGPQDIVWFDE